MKKLLVIATVFITIVFAELASGYFGVLPEIIWNQELIVTVKTPQGIKKGSSITLNEVRLWPHRLWPYNKINAKAIFHDWTGEATVVNLGDDKYLFALIGQPGFFSPVQLFKNSIDGRFGAKFGDLLQAYPNIYRLNASSPIGSHRYNLLFVIFTDINDPTSIQIVDYDKLENYFGAGYIITRLSIGNSGKNVTQGKIKKVLSWMDDVDEIVLRQGSKKDGYDKLILRATDFISPTKYVGEKQDNDVEASARWQKSKKEQR